MPRGELYQRGHKRLVVEGTNNLQGGDVSKGDRPAGFHILLDGQGIAAVELFNDGVVMIDTGVPTPRRDAVAVVAAGMFLWDDLVYPRR